MLGVVPEQNLLEYINVYLTFDSAHSFKESFDIIALRNNFNHDQVALPPSIILVSVHELSCFAPIVPLRLRNELFLLYLIGLSAHHLRPE